MREMWEPRPSSPTAIDSKSFFPLSEASLCLKEAGERENRKRARGDGNEKKKTGQRLPPFLSSHFPPLFNSFYFYYFFEYPAGATAKERAFFFCFVHNANLLLSIFLPSSVC